MTNHEIQELICRKKAQEAQKERRSPARRADIQFSAFPISAFPLPIPALQYFSVSAFLR